MKLIARCDWYAADPADLSATRVNLNFGLRADDSAYRRLVVPGAGRVWFVRELSWAIGALALMPRLAAAMEQPQPVAVAHAIEALGSKLAWWRHPENEPFPRRRVLGRRAFVRDRNRERWSFKELSRRENYVQNTHRQAVVTSLRLDGGLGLTTGRRFAQMRPAGLGIDLADAFLGQIVGSGSGRLDAKLVAWIGAGGSGEHQGFIHRGDTGVRALGPLAASEEEARIVSRALFEGSSPDAVTRSALADALRDHETLPDIRETVVKALRKARREAQARNVLAALGFGTMLDAVIGVAMSCREPIAAAAGRRPIRELVGHAETVTAYGRLRETAGEYRAAAETAGTWDGSEGARQLVLMVEGEKPDHVVANLLARADELFDVVDGTVGPGNLFRRIQTHARPVDDEDAEESLDPSATDRTFNIEGFYELVRDCRRAGGASA